MSIRALLTIGALGLLTVTSAQDAPRIVWVQTVVTDGQDRLVTSLRREDFSILAGEETRLVTVFSKNEMPVALSLMLDVSGSMRKQATPARQAATLLIDRFGRGDRVNIGAFDAAVQVSDRFTANRAHIAWSLQQPLTGAAMPCVVTPERRPIGVREESSLSRGGGGTAMWDGIWCGVRELQRDTESIRKVLVLISDGMENSSRGSEQTSVGLAHAAGVVVYIVGLPGTDQSFTGRSDRRLRELAAATGGRYFPLEDKDPLEPVFDRIGEELRSHYVLGFEPRTPTSSGNLSVQVRVPGLTARARTRYLASGR